MVRNHIAKMENNIEDNTGEKIKVLLHTYECLNDRIVTNCKMAYNIGFISVTSIVLVIIYSITVLDFKSCIFSFFTLYQKINITEMNPSNVAKIVISRVSISKAACAFIENRLYKEICII